MCLAIPGEITALCGARRAALRQGALRRRRRARSAWSASPTPWSGDFVLVHVGMAIARIDREEAERSWQLLAELGQLTELDDGTDPTSTAAADMQESWP